MPLRDHFQPPLRDDCPCESFHSAWANAIVGWLNQKALPAEYRAIPRVRATDTFEVQVRDAARRRLVAAVELVSPANKDRPTHRRDFVIKCASYLRQRVAVVVVDVVTERRDNLHAELMQLLELPPAMAEAGAFRLYAAAYRLKVQEEEQRLELWPEELRVGEALPTLPLWIGEEDAVPLDLEASYDAASELLRIR
jgi:hypothetical protein